MTDSNTKLFLRLFSGIFYVIGWLFLVVLALNFMGNLKSSQIWAVTWADWLFKGLVFAFLGFFCQCLEKLLNKFIALDEQIRKINRL